MTKVYRTDDGWRADTDQQRLSKLKPVFDKPFGLITAGSSAQVSDGAACLLLASEKAVKKFSLNVKARIAASSWAALDPSEMGLGPVHAVSKLLSKSHLKSDHVDYWEINEAFAAQVLACLAAMKDKNYCTNYLPVRSLIGEIDEEKLNIHGGAIACGHPIGMTGARIVLHAANTLKLLRAKRGIATLCIGGGQGGAMLIENMQT